MARAGLFMSQVLTRGAKVKMMPGDHYTVVLPSGKELALEVTQDTADVCQGDRVLFNEEFAHGEWVQTCPTPE